MSDKKTKCSVKDHNIDPCWALEETIEEHHRRKGISMMEFFNLETSKPTRSVVIVKSGKHVKKGLMFNYCPFCREDIGSHMAKKG